MWQERVLFLFVDNYSTLMIRTKLRKTHHYKEYIYTCICIYKHIPTYVYSTSTSTSVVLPTQLGVSLRMAKRERQWYFPCDVAWAGPELQYHTSSTGRERRDMDPPNNSRPSVVRCQSSVVRGQWSEVRGPRSAVVPSMWNRVSGNVVPHWYYLYFVLVVPVGYGSFFFFWVFVGLFVRWKIPTNKYESDSQFLHITHLTHHRSYTYHTSKYNTIQFIYHIT